MQTLREKIDFATMTGVLAVWIVFTSPSIHAEESALTGGILKSLTFHASFNQGSDADYAKGDSRIYTMTDRDPAIISKPGVHTDEMTIIASNQGLFGDALQFTRRASNWLYYKADKNLSYTHRDWQGTVSLWLSLDPQKDLDPGFCDPIQITPRQWNDAAFFVDFDKAGNPRDFRLGAFADIAVWNDQNQNLNDIPDSQRPLLKVHSPPFARDQWTHVVFTWSHFNTGEKNGVAAFYLNGKLQGEITGWDQSFTWKPDEESRILIGLNYIGLFDELSCFDRALASNEINRLYELKGEFSNAVKLKK
jgi:hypothetical protein